MGFLDRITQSAPYLDTRHDRGLVSHAVETGEYIGASYLAGRINTQYGARAKWRGHDLTYVAGLGGKLLAVAGDILGLPASDLWGHHVNTVSNAFLGAHFCAMGAEHGLAANNPSYDRTQSDYRALPPGKPAPLPTPAPTAVKGTSLGAIPPAPQPGKYLDLNKVAAIASM